MPLYDIKLFNYTYYDELTFDQTRDASVIHIGEKLCKKEKNIF